MEVIITNLETINLKEKSVEFMKMAELAMNLKPPLYEQMISNFHFAVELVLKSYARKNHCTYPKTHNLLLIVSSIEAQGVEIISKMTKQLEVINSWGKICSAWDTERRYVVVFLTTDEYEIYYESYRRVYQWIENQLNLA